MENSMGWQPLEFLQPQVKDLEPRPVATPLPQNPSPHDGGCGNPTLGPWVVETRGDSMVEFVGFDGDRI